MSSLPALEDESSKEEDKATVTSVGAVESAKQEEEEEGADLGAHQYMVDKLTAICEEGDGLDIYQYCAFMSFVKRMNMQRVNEVCTSELLREDCGSCKQKHKAFMKLRRETRAAKKSYQYCVLKALICASLQIGAAIGVIIHELRDIRQGKGKCTPKADRHTGILKAVVILFAAYMSLEFSSLFVEIREGGLYEGKLLFERYNSLEQKAKCKSQQHNDSEEEIKSEDTVISSAVEKSEDIKTDKLKSAMETELKVASKNGSAAVGADDFEVESDGWCSFFANIGQWFVDRAADRRQRGESLALVPMPPFVDVGWVVFGRNVNYVTASLALYASQIVLYNSDTALDAILNSVAMLFLIGLDDDFITATGYRRFGRFLQNYRQNAAAFDKYKIRPHKYISYFMALQSAAAYASIIICFLLQVLAPIWFVLCY